MVLELRIKQKGYGICPEGEGKVLRHVSGVSLNGGLIEKPLCEAVKLKPGFSW